MNTRLFTLIIYFSLVYFSFLHAQSKGVQERDYSIDLADVLSSTEEEKLDGLSKKFEEQTNVQIVFYTIDNLDGRGIREVSREAASKLGVGFHAINSGILVCFAKKEAEVRVEVGFGMEWTITENQTQAIEDKIRPYFIKNDCAGGFKTSFNEIKKIIGKETWFLAYKPFSKIREEGSKAIGTVIKEDFVKIGEESEGNITLNLYGNIPIKIHFTPYMAEELLPRLEKSKKVVFRLKNSQPLEGYLMGLD